MATLAALRAQGYTDTILALDETPPREMPDGLRVIPATDFERTLSPETLVIRSPGFAPHHPMRQRLDAWGGEQTTATRLFLAALRVARIPVIGVTASKGKSTISALCHTQLEETGVACELVGNIGIPALSRLDSIVARQALVVLELSSYQCDDLQPGEGPDTVILGTLFPEHLDWHGSLKRYYTAKTRLARAIPAGGRLLIHAGARPILATHGLLDGVLREDISIEWVNHPAGLHVAADGTRFFDGLVPQVQVEMRLPGQHNRENACLAFAASRQHGADAQAFARALVRFDGLPYRLQDEGWHAGIRWINDSISTAPEAACAALEAFHTDGRTLIVGGQDRGYDYHPLADALQRSQVSEVIVLPDSGAALAACMQVQGSRQTIHVAGNLATAVRVAASVTPQGQLCLFSPAAPSYHLWTGFEARGAEFRALIRGLD